MQSGLYIYGMAFKIVSIFIAFYFKGSILKMGSPAIANFNYISPF